MSSSADRQDVRSVEHVGRQARWKTWSLQGIEAVVSLQDGLAVPTLEMNALAHRRSISSAISLIRGRSINCFTGAVPEIVAARRLGDIDREIADALQIAVDLDRRHNDAQIDRHRLVQGQQLEAAIVDLDLQRSLIGSSPWTTSSSITGSRSTSPLDRTAIRARRQPRPSRSKRLLERSELFDEVRRLRC